MILGSKVFVRSTLVLSALLLSITAHATEFPTGQLKGVGLKVERGNMVITHNDLYKYESKAIVESLKNDRIRMTIEATMQKAKGTRIKNDRRVDTFKVKWDSDSSGKLINEANAYKGDKTTFALEGDKLTITSWIARHQSTETQIYKVGM
jgi:hypothetical protein